MTPWLTRHAERRTAPFADPAIAKDTVRVVEGGSVSVRAGATEFATRAGSRGVVAPSEQPSPPGCRGTQRAALAAGAYDRMPWRGPRHFTTRMTTWTILNHTARTSFTTARVDLYRRRSIARPPLFSARSG
jgi:hypothetical protein